MLHSHLVNYTWEEGYVASEDMLAIADFFVSSGLQKLGYTYANWDDCIVIGRDPVTHELIPDPRAFPDGVRAVADALSTKGFKMGWYTVRGEALRVPARWPGQLRLSRYIITLTCVHTRATAHGPPRLSLHHSLSHAQLPTGNFTCASIKPYYPQRPGSNGHEDIDARSYAAWGVTYLKDDTCVGPNVPYSIMGAALNASGVPTFFSLCEPGQGPVTAPVGRATSNGWRVDEDDGAGWRPILDNVAMNAPLFPYAGCDEQHGMDGKGCGWNDMGLLLVGGGMTPDQDESHMALWAIMASKLLISVDPRKFTPHALALVSNPELIAIDQDALKLQGQRVVPPVSPGRAAADAARIRAWKAAHLEGGSWRAAGRSGELLAALAVPGSDLGAVPGTEVDEALAAGGRAEVWQRQLHSAAPGTTAYALLLFNNGLATGETEIACQGACWARMGFAPGAAVAVRDVLARADNGTATDGFSARVRVNGTVLVRLQGQSA
jgi:hypothetical protein